MLNNSLNYFNYNNTMSEEEKESNKIDNYFMKLTSFFNMFFDKFIKKENKSHLKIMT